MLQIQGQPFLDMQLIVSVLAIIYYSYILYLIITSRSKTLKSAFFRIYLATGICDILGIIALEWTRAEMKSSIGPDFEPLTRVLITMTGINFFTHILGCLLMTLNRFTAVCFPDRQQEIWCTRNLCAFLIFGMFFAIIIHIEALLMKFLYEPTAEGGWILVGRNGSVNRVRIIGSALTLQYEVISIVLISYTIYVINKQLRESGHRLSQDMNLVFVTAINCVMSIFECIYDISFLLNFTSPVIQWIKDRYELNFLLIMTTNSFTIFFLSYSLRQEFAQRWWTLTKVQSFQASPRTGDATSPGLN